MKNMPLEVIVKDAAHGYDVVYPPPPADEYTGEEVPYIRAAWTNIEDALPPVGMVVLLVNPERFWANDDLGMLKAIGCRTLWHGDRGHWTLGMGPAQNLEAWPLWMPFPSLPSNKSISCRS